MQKNTASWEAVHNVSLIYVLSRTTLAIPHIPQGTYVVMQGLLLHDRLYPARINIYHLLPVLFCNNLTTLYLNAHPYSEVVKFHNLILKTDECIIGNENIYILVRHLDRSLFYDQHFVVRWWFLNFNDTGLKCTLSPPLLLDILKPTERYHHERRKDYEERDPHRFVFHTVGVHTIILLLILEGQSYWHCLKQLTP
jgi:hypothetical protein